MKKVLHVGCGQSTLPSDLYNPSEWHETRADFDSDVHPDVLCDIMNLPFQDETYDSIFGSHILEHFDKYQRNMFMKSCIRTLKVGGSIVMLLPNICAPQVLNAMRSGNLDAQIYVSPACPVAAYDMIFGGYYNHPGYMHKWGYSNVTLHKFMSLYLTQVKVHIINDFELLSMGIKP